ncbi:unnamed protein product [Sphagnum troendelagicum]|uniref:Uncharacterized protein n=1 Tax=Sphagnum troendelagicum TaxID=128251 RepID=A0ABP0T7C6_9BRYO
MLRQFLFLSLLLHVAYGQISIKNFVPFGTNHGDAMMARPIDAVTGPIHISIRFPFFDKWYDEIKLYSHGLILFGNITYVLPHSPPGPFPLRNFVCAAPYWADTNIAQDASSNIFYRQVTDEDTLIEISSMVRNGFPLLSAHRMLWAFVATWYRVPGHMTDPGRNTYQAIITTNGLYSFTLFTYNQLQWSAGLWGGFPQIGFNAGDQVNYFTLEKSFTANVITVVQDSNIGVPGQFIFHTTGNISDVQCNSTEGLQSSPFRGSMYGGYELRLFGICFNESSYIVEINGQELENCELTTVYLTCTMPMVSEGRLQIRLFTSERRLIGQTDFLAFMPENNADLILSNNGELDTSAHIREDQRLNLLFQKNALTTNYLFRIIIYDYSIQQFIANGTFYNQTMQQIDLGLGALNLSAIRNLTINYESIFPIDSEPRDRVHSLGISFELVPQSATSKSFTWKGATKFLVRPFIVPDVLFSSYCPAWLELQSDTNTQNLINKVPACPCRVSTTWDEEQLGFNTDPACNARKSGLWNCRFHRGAKGCYRRKSLTSDAGAQCCYDNNGVWINDWRSGAGTIDAYYPETLKNLSTYQHFFSDVLSYFSCCGGVTEFTSNCEKYMKHRPPGRCENLLPAPTGGQGDPHFLTLAGSSYTFNGHGEYTLLESLDGQLEIQVRLARVVNESAPPSSVSSMDNATAIVAFVIHSEDQPRVQFELFSQLQLVEIRIDERVLEFTPFSEEDELLSSSLIYSDDYQLIIRQRDAKTYSISYGESGIQFIVYLRPQFDFLDLVSLIPRINTDKRQFQGILGGFDGLAYANGTRVPITSNDDQALFNYGESWRTTSNASLFYYRFQDSHAQHQDLTYRPTFLRDLFDKYTNTSRYRLAEEVCQNLTQRQQCMYDVLITNDPTVNQMHQHYETTLQAWDEYIELVEQDEENDKTTTTKSPKNAASKYSVNKIWATIILLAMIIAHK